MDNDEEGIMLTLMIISKYYALANILWPSY
jgi:hypothetical protein